MELEAERADALDEGQLDEVMNVFGGGMIAHEGLAGFRGVIGGDGVECCSDLLAFGGGEDVGGDEGGRVGLAGCNFLREQAPIEDDGALPLLKLCVERLAKAARPHFYGLVFGGHLIWCAFVVNQTLLKNNRRSFDSICAKLASARFSLSHTDRPQTSIVITRIKTLCHRPQKIVRFISIIS